MPYSFLEHTADMRMNVTGKTLEHLFRDALLGMVALMSPSKQKEAQKVRRTIILEAQDATALLVDFLSEALMLMHTEREAYTGAQFHLISEHSLEVELVGYVIESFGEDIKAVTYHEANVKKNSEGAWLTTIIFDI